MARRARRTTVADDDVGYGAERLAYLGKELARLIVGLSKFLLVVMAGAWGAVRSKRNAVRGS